MNVSEVVQVDPEILGGTPVFTGTRVPIVVLFENLADGLSLVEILDSYPTIKREQAIEALRIAQDRLIAHCSRLRLADLLAENAKEPPAEDDNAPPAIISSSESPSLRCAQLQPRVAPLEKRAGVPDAVYGEWLLEHPAIPGLMLTKEERLYGALLEILDSDGAIRTETFEEKRFRIKWKQPIPVANTESLKDFVKMHHESFGPPKNR